MCVRKSFEKQNIYLAYVKGTKDKKIDQNDTDFKQYLSKQNSNNRNTILKTYDLLFVYSVTVQSSSSKLLYY